MQGWPRCAAAVASIALVACTTFGAPADAGAGADGGSGADAGADAAVTDCGPAGCPKLCKSLHDAHADAKSAVYELDPGGSRPRLTEYCDMEKEGGGWTLVARSVANSNSKGAFGWFHDLGAADDDTRPYSLGIGALGSYEVRELLFGAYAEGKTWATPVYHHDLPPGFVSAYQTKGYQAGAARTVSGSCKPTGGPSFLVWIGRTGVDDHWFFRDNDDGTGFGLFADGWNSNYDNIRVDQRCSAGADLGDKQAMIFVR
jgi:hypothetical protein